MKNESIPSKIIDILTKESRLTINEIFEKSDLEIERKEYIRLCVNRLSGAENPKIVKNGKSGKEYLYSLKENAINPIELFSEYNELFKELTKTPINKENLMKLAKETLSFDKIKKLEELIEKNGFLG